MKMILRIGGLALAFLMMETGCKEKKNEVTPIDSTQIFPSGSVSQFIIKNNVFVDTGALVTIKGKDFDPKMRDRYFLLVMHETTKRPKNVTTISREFKINEQVRDSNLKYIDDSTIIFELPKHTLYDSNSDSAYLYFTGLKGKEIYPQNDGSKSAHTQIISSSQVFNIPIYKLLKDTLYINKTYDSKNKQIIQGTYSSEAIKVVIQNLEYKSATGYFIKSVDYNAPIPLRVTLSMVATQDLFYLSDGSYSFEIYERNGNQRKFVEETGKTKIYIKNIP